MAAVVEVLRLREPSTVLAAPTGVTPACTVWATISIIATALGKLTHLSPPLAAKDAPTTRQVRQTNAVQLGLLIAEATLNARMATIVITKVLAPHSNNLLDAAATHSALTVSAALVARVNLAAAVATIRCTTTTHLNTTMLSKEAMTAFLGISGPQPSAPAFAQTRGLSIAHLSNTPQLPSSVY